jgi:hypothetical protein
VWSGLKRVFYPANKALKKNRKYRDEPILVFTMGKVGTESIVRALTKSEVNVYKAHSLRKDVLQERIKKARERNTEPRTDLIALEFVEKIQPTSDRIKMITVVRESVGRNISGFFQTLWRHGIEPPFNDIKVEALIELFFDKFNHERPDKWFNQEFETQIGLKPFALDFDPSIGHIRISSGKYDILFMQIELGNKILSELISEFVGIKVDIIHEHKGTDETYGQLYKEFKRTIEFPVGYLANIMKSRVMQSFYSNDQRQHIVNFYMKEAHALLPFPVPEENRKRR